MSDMYDLAKWRARKGVSVADCQITIDPSRDAEAKDTAVDSLIPKKKLVAYDQCNPSDAPTRDGKLTPAAVQKQTAQCYKQLQNMNMKIPTTMSHT